MVVASAIPFEIAWTHAARVAAACGADAVGREEEAALARVQRRCAGTSCALVGPARRHAAPRHRSRVSVGGGGSPPACGPARRGIAALQSARATLNVSSTGRPAMSLKSTSHRLRHEPQWRDS